MLTRIDPMLPDTAWLRTCQECGKHQTDNRPDMHKELTDAYRNRKCRKCKSESLDYGKENASLLNWDE